MPLKRDNPLLNKRINHKSQCRGVERVLSQMEPINGSVVLRYLYVCLQLKVLNMINKTHKLYKN